MKSIIEPNFTKYRLHLVRIQNTINMADFILRGMKAESIQTGNMKFQNRAVALRSLATTGAKDCFRNCGVRSKRPPVCSVLTLQISYRTKFGKKPPKKMYTYVCSSLMGVCIRKGTITRKRAVTDAKGNGILSWSG